MTKPVVGDIVTSEPALNSPLFESWGRDDDRIVGYFIAGIAIVIETRENSQGSGCRIMTSDGQVGWTHAAYLEVAP